MIKTGFLLINKPVGMSSYACIGRIKYILGIKKRGMRIGHAGTLDPFACGLLIVAIGREATRLLSQCMVMEKTYIATGKCGELTDTLDCTGTVVATSDIIPTEAALRASLDSFGSEYEQIPPLYSALKYQGKPLYLLARKKMMEQEQLQEVADAKRRTIQLYDKKFLSYSALPFDKLRVNSALATCPPKPCAKEEVGSTFFTIQVRVSHGTYIRTLINDIAVRAGSCATTYELARIAIGPFSLDKAVDMASLMTIESINEHLIAIDEFFPKKS
jgi:tRNA pseudouridine55 synthase